MDSEGTVPIRVLAEALEVSVRTLKRWYAKGWLPVVILGRLWTVPKSFLVMLFSSPQPAKAAVLQDVAARWFADHAPSGGAS